MEFEHQEEHEAAAAAAAAPPPPPHELGLRPPSYDSETAQPNPSSRTLNNMNNNKDDGDDDDDDDDSPSPIATVPSPTPATIGGNKKARARYRECLKNHAVGIGGQAVDGCGEFMPAGPEGSLDGLKCAACNCHRNFHRKELEVPRNQTTQQQQAVVYQYPVLVPHNQHQHYNHPSTGSAPPHQNQNPHLYQFYPHSNRTGTAAPPGSGGYHHHHLDVGGGGRPLALPCVSGGTGAQSRGGEDEEEDVSNQDTPGGGGGITGGSSGGGGGGYTTVGSSSKKRFRTKFNQEQKDKMLELAEQLGWKIQKQDEGLIQSFCNETGVKRQVLKVWMHNNKHTLGKKKALN